MTLIPLDQLKPANTVPLDQLSPNVVPLDKLTPNYEGFTGVVQDASRLGGATRAAIRGGFDGGLKGIGQNLKEGFDDPFAQPLFAETFGSNDGSMVSPETVKSVDAIRAGTGSPLDYIRVAPAFAREFAKAGIGFAGDVVTDPLSYVPLGLLAKTGATGLNKIPVAQKAAQAVGKTSVVKGLKKGIDAVGGVLNKRIGAPATTLDDVLGEMLGSAAKPKTQGLPKSALPKADKKVLIERAELANAPKLLEFDGVIKGQPPPGTPKTFSTQPLDIVEKNAVGTGARNVVSLEDLTPKKPVAVTSKVEPKPQPKLREPFKPLVQDSPLEQGIKKTAAPDSPGVEAKFLKKAPIFTAPSKAKTGIEDILTPKGKKLRKVKTNESGKAVRSKRAQALLEERVKKKALTPAAKKKARLAEIKKAAQKRTSKKTSTVVSEEQFYAQLKAKDAEIAAIKAARKSPQQALLERNLFIADYISNRSSGSFKFGKGLKNKKGSTSLFSSSDPRRKVITKNIDRIKDEMSKSGKSLESVLIGMKDKAGNKLFTPDEVARLVRGKPLKVPVSESAIKKGVIITEKRSGNAGEVLEVTEKGAKVRFAEGVSTLKNKELKSKFKVEDLSTKDPVEAAKEVARRIKPNSKGTERATTAANDLVEDALTNPNTKIDRTSTNKFVKEMTDLIGSGDIKGAGIRKMLKDFHMTPQELGQIMRETASEAGKELNIWSQASKQIRQKLRDDPDILKELGIDQLDENAVLKFIHQKLRTAATLYQASLISNFATASRNLLMAHVSKGTDIMSAYLGGMFNNATGSGLRGAEFVEANSKARYLARSMQGVKSFIARKLTGDVTKDAEFEAYKRILDAFPFEKSRIMNASIADATFTDSISKTLTFFNNAQERLVRRMAFESQLLSILRKQGLKIDFLSEATGKNLEFLKQNSHLMIDAVDHALNISFANQPQLNFFKKLVDTWRAAPILSFIHPFMRFATISTEWTVMHSPLPYLNLADKGFRKALFSTNNAKQAKIIADATVGMGLLGGAMMIRNDPNLAGGKWYQIKIGTNKKNGDSQYLDIRPYFPLSPYFFMAEAMKNLDTAFVHPDKRRTSKLTSNDWVEGLTGVRRLTSTPLALTHVFKSMEADNPDKAWETFKKINGSIAAGYTTWARQLSDMYSMIDPEDALPRSTKEAPFIGPIIANVPVLKQRLPRISTITEGEIDTTFNPVIRQISGVSFQEASVFENEYNRLGLFLNPKTGDAKADRIIMKFAGPNIKAVGNVIVKMPFYQKLNDKDRADVIKAFVEENKEEIKEIVDKFPSPKLQAMEARRMRSSILKKIIKDVTP